MLLSDHDLQVEILRMTDAYTDELFQIAAATVRFPVSRLLVDPERFENDAEEMMAKVGMGAIYTRTSSGQPLRYTPSAEQREALLESYYRPHHGALTQAVEEALAASGGCLIIDAHSFPSKPLPYELDQNPERPDICIGTDDFHTPPALRDALVSHFLGMGYSVAINRPFSGALVPSRFYRKYHRVQSAMVEVNRRLYMDEDTGTKSSGFDQVRDAISTVLSRLPDVTAASASTERN